MKVPNVCDRLINISYCLKKTTLKCVYQEKHVRVMSASRAPSDVSAHARLHLIQFPVDWPSLFLRPAVNVLCRTATTQSSLQRSHGMCAGCCTSSLSRNVDSLLIAQGFLFQVEADYVVHDYKFAYPTYDSVWRKLMCICVCVCVRVDGSIPVSLRQDTLCRHTVWVFSSFHAVPRNVFIDIVNYQSSTACVSVEKERNK